MIWDWSSSDVYALTFDLFSVYIIDINIIIDNCSLCFIFIFVFL
jgi:hypothetical protein